MRRALAVLAIGLAGCVAEEDAGAGGAAGASHQDVTVIQDCPEPCPGIELDHVATLGSPADSVLLYWHSVLAVGDSLVAAGRVPARGVIPLYDLQGRQVKVVGRYGGGPGEFRGPRPMAGPGGSLWVVDIGNQRISILGPGGSLIRHFSLYGGPRAVVPLGPDRALVAGFVVGDSTEAAAYRTEAPPTGGGPARQRWRAAPGAAPAPFHVVDGHGNILASFGEWPGFGEVGFPPAATALSDGTVLTNRSGSYALEKRTADGDIVDVLERKVEWFQPHARLSGPGSGPTLSGMRAAGDTLWTRIYLPTGTGLEAGRRGESLGLSDIQRTADVMVEVIDLETPQVIARQRFPDITLKILEGSDLWYTAREDDLGYVAMDLWRARIVPSP